jgi:HK97 family phage major capsid protein
MQLTMAQLEQKFEEMYEKKVTAEREKILSELKGQNEAVVKEAIDTRLKAMEIEEGRMKAIRADTMAILEANYLSSSSKGLPSIKPEIMVGQMMVSSGKALLDAGKRTGFDPEAAMKMSEKLFPESKALHQIWKKELTAGQPSAGGFAIPQVLLPDYINFLYATTILDKLGIQKVPMPAGNFSLPRMDATSTVAWVDEIESDDITGETFGNVSLAARKMKAMTAMSNTLLRQNVVGLDAWVARDLQYMSRILLDKAFLYGKGTQFTPKGIKNQDGIQTTGTTGTPFALNTPIDMIALLEQANVPMQNVKWIFSPIGKSWILSKAFSSGPWAWAKEMLEQKTLAGYEFVTSASVEKDSASAYSDFWVGDFSQALWGVAYDLSIEVSREGTYKSGGTLVSAFDKDITLVRVIGEHDFGVRQPKAFVYGQFSKV